MITNEQFRHLLAGYKQLKKENVYLKRLNAELIRTPNSDRKFIEREIQQKPIKNEETNYLSNYSLPDEKVSLFRSLFHGRDDVYSVRWESKKGMSGYSPACRYEWQRPICRKPEIACSKCPNRTLLPLNQQTIFEHLSGEKTVGLYPMLKNEKCWFLAVDFDKKSWQEDVQAFLKVSKQYGLPFCIERSRSGNGAHLWLFFMEPIPAKSARQLGAILLSKTLEECYELGLDSFDRLFPNQDTMPKGGFGNLIALPLQKKARMRGNSIFVDENWTPYSDQWLYLSSVHKVNQRKIDDILSNLSTVNKKQTKQEWPDKIKVVITNGIYLNSHKLPSMVLDRIRELACFSNPEFYRKQARRMTMSGIPHKINCSDEIGENLVIPRGCLDKLKSLAKEHSMEITIEDQRYIGIEIEPVFHGRLTSIQQDALETLLENDYGILAAVPGFGKTVVSAALLAKRKVNTLIVVHRLQLLEQWIEKISLLLGISKNEIGQIGGGKNRITGTIDIAMIQSLNGKSGVKALVTQYGQVIVDECHHIAAYSFEKVLKHIRTKFVLGLTATPVRKDGLHPIIEMQCGPIRFKVNAKTQSKVQTFNHILLPRQTKFKSELTDIQKLFTELVNDQDRNDLIFNDVLESLEEKRKPIIITERVAHASTLKKRFAPFVKQIVVLSGQGKRSERKHELQYLADLPAEVECLVIATGKYIGEGFDDSRLDTLFLVMPISWKGTLEQYVGRLHREHPNKNEVRVYDYVDSSVPVLNKMYQKRLKGYRAMGYVHVSQSSNKSEQMRLF
ncbi:TOTE conflict system archaeo-eukaryotic primase domain-containing protein [Sporolactobacillus nakayamae]|uniref:Helicase ATP-binding domain-containing protein n=1 Tax=Sporolactobacillus nakayamae TaxID=269670 RepID=A0A1I2U5W6_9BACL|nr:DEAD/DEAH box helicase [Sporolactobacillus nakayamae]SFG72468.1 hypothetical protein SAMN02982927_02559 [Sporolactobacillus nakayamae]